MPVDVSHRLQIIKSVLEAATKEDRGSNGLSPNRWVLVHRPTQQTFSKPTAPPVTAFETGFLNTSIDELEQFIETTFGDGRLGSASQTDMFDYIADNGFGVVDDRTARDDTILFCARELVDAVQEAQICVAWHKGSERDKALVRYLNKQETDEDVEFLVGEIYGEDDMNAREDEDLRTRLGKWVLQDQQQCTEKWATFRLKHATAMSDIIGIFHIGVHDALEKLDDFDEDGVLIH